MFILPLILLCSSCCCLTAKNYILTHAYIASLTERNPFFRAIGRTTEEKQKIIVAVAKKISKSRTSLSLSFVSSSSSPRSSSPFFSSSSSLLCLGFSSSFSRLPLLPFFPSSSREKEHAATICRSCLVSLSLWRCFSNSLSCSLQMMSSLSYFYVC